MKKFFLLSFLLMICQSQMAQIRGLDRGINGLGGLNQQQVDSLDNEEITVKLSGKTHYTDYKIISHKYDTTYVDTTLTIKKEYKFNFLRKDNFELLQFHNQGQTFNNLAYDYRAFQMYPDIGFRAKQFNYFNINDINYYNVPTPTTEILYKTGQEQGQVLDAFFTLNFSKRLNVSVAYKGLRSLGHYRRSLVSLGNFRATFSYQTPQNQYVIRAHVATQDNTSQESGGLTPASLDTFVNNDPNFSDRARLDVNLNDAENMLKGTRFYIDHNYKLFSSKDSTNTKDFSNLKIGHQFISKNKEYNFSQSTLTNEFFGESNITTGKVYNTTEYSFMNNQAYLEFNSKYVLGRFKVKANYTTVAYGYDFLLNSNAGLEKIELKGKSTSLGASWRGTIGNFNVNADATIIPGSGHLAGNYIDAEALYKKDSLFTVKGTISQISKAPNFNFQLYQSNYNDYNWNNDFVNVDTRNLGFEFLSKWINASLDFTNIEDYAYFDVDNKPKQYGGSIAYLKLKANKEFTVGKFSLDNTLMYQNVTSGSEVFRVPSFVIRNTLYYTDEWFKGKPLLVNIGFTFKYFTKYKMNAYNPLLSEFTLQNDTEIGYPTLDFFLNMRVRRARIYFKLDNVSSFLRERNYFSAPNYPYRDFSIRFGLVWNWFI